MTVLRADPSIKYAGSEATAIADAFRVFFAALHDLLSVVIGKAGFLTKIPFIGPPISSVLRSIEGVVKVSLLVLRRRFPRRLDDVGLTCSADRHL